MKESYYSVLHNLSFHVSSNYFYGILKIHSYYLQKPLESVAFNFMWFQGGEKLKSLSEVFHKPYLYQK